MPIVVGVFTEVNSMTLVGGSANVTIIAPLPALDNVEMPLEFVAFTFAKMLEPYARLNGEATRSDTDI
jgi:hypothetical protein